MRSILSLLNIIILHFNGFGEVSDSQQGQENLLRDWKFGGVFLSSIWLCGSICIL